MCRPAIRNLGLRAVEVKVVHPDACLAVSELGRVGRTFRPRKSELLADDPGLGVVEFVVADGAPLAEVKDLNVALKQISCFDDSSILGKGS